MILDSFLRGLHSERKLDFSGILFTSDRRGSSGGNKTRKIIISLMNLYVLVT